MFTNYRRELSKIRPSAWSFLIGSALMGGAFAVPWTLLPLYLERLAYSKTQIGGVQSAEAWGQVLVALPGAVLLARRRTPPLLAISCLVAALGFVVLPWLPTAWAMQACKFAIGAGWWLHHVAIAPFLYRHSDAEERPVLFGLAEAVHTAAGVVGAFGCGKLADLLANGPIGETEAMAWVLACSGALPAIAALVYLRIPETAPAVAPGTRLWPIFVAHRGLLARFAFPQLIVGIGAGLSIPFLGLYFQDRFDKPPGTVGELYAAWQALATVGFLLSPVLVRHLGFVSSMVALELASIPFFLILAFTGNYPLAVFAFLLRGALMNASGPVLKTLMMEASPDGVREAQVALNSTAWGLAWVAGPWIGGLVLDRTGGSYATLMCTTVGFYLAASISTWILLRRLDPRAKSRAKEAE